METRPLVAFFGGRYIWNESVWGNVNVLLTAFVFSQFLLFSFVKQYKFSCDCIYITLKHWEKISYTSYHFLKTWHKTQIKIHLKLESLNTTSLETIICKSHACLPDFQAFLSSLATNTPEQFIILGNLGVSMLIFTLFSSVLKWCYKN